MTYGSSVDVFLLWHVRHARLLDGTPTRHRDGGGNLIWDEEDGDDLKILGVYSTEQGVQDRIARARTLPGFRDEPDCFMTDRYTLDDDQWNEGFVSTTDEDDHLTP
jgi:hypothetical protein